MTSLPIGINSRERDDVFSIDPRGFNRHTFWCGQSGSGKTYSLGVLLEEIVLRTGLPVFVLDPNSDFTNFGELATVHKLVPSEEIRVVRPGGAGTEGLNVRFTELSLKSKAAILRLDPVTDYEDFNTLLRVDGKLQENRDEYAVGGDYVGALRSSEDPTRERLATRIENLEILDWDIWAHGSVSSADLVESRRAFTSFDLGALRQPEEVQIAALSALERLWASRFRREPLLIVVEEAHNFCPPNPDTALKKQLADLFIKIASEGRKFGLWLLLSTQRPNKLEPQVLSQCENVGLLRLNSKADRNEIQSSFNFLEPELIDESPFLKSGEVILAGRFVQEPGIVQMKRRLTKEGGADVKVPMKRPLDANAK
ncbi:ATP-binding protein [Microbacterium maritypicum]|uniref:ATP-binding protein n=1 Tax=Microbacterium maritypicum TaxID=33918 RepID=UPI0037F4F736